MLDEREREREIMNPVAEILDINNTHCWLFHHKDAETVTCLSGIIVAGIIDRQIQMPPIVYRQYGQFLNILACYFDEHS